MSEANWLEQLTSGDTVVVETGWSYTSMERATVTRTTPTQVLIGESRYRKDDGVQIGLWKHATPVRIIEATPERLEQIARKEPAEKLARCSSAAWARLPSERLIEIVKELADAGMRWAQ